MPFSSAHPSLRRALVARGFVAASPVQAAIMAPEVDVRDLLVSAQTGSGKTVAFGLALARTLLGDAERFTAAGAPRALIVTPTRELAMQVHRELSWLYAETSARITTCVGGMDPRRESQALGNGVHIVVGTPGRLCDHLARKSLVLDRLAAVVLDEADEMLDMGFREDLERLLDAAPKDRRTLLFSATIPAPIATLAKRYQRDAMRIATSGEGDRHRDIEYQVVSVVPRERDLAVVNLLRYHNPPGALVFCATRDRVTHLAANLSERGFSVAALSGELSQRERNQALQALRDGRARVCVATDVAARGLDLPDLGLVIHADLPQNKETLVHRSGRTGRAGKHGLAILISIEAARRFIERLLYTARVEATWLLPPSSDDIRSRDQQHLVSEVTALTETISDADRAVARTLLAERSAEDLVAALVGLRREARPAPEELTLPSAARPRSPADRGGPTSRDVPGRSRYDRPVRGPIRGHDDRAGSDRGLHNGRAERPTRPERAPFAAGAGRLGGGPGAHGSGNASNTAGLASNDVGSAGPDARVEPGPGGVALRSAAAAPASRSPHSRPTKPKAAIPAADSQDAAAPVERPGAAPAAHDRAAAQTDAELSSSPAPRGERADLVELLGAPLDRPGRVASATAHDVPPRRSRSAPADRAEYVRHDRAPHAESPGERDGNDDDSKQVWFTINIGRSKNADPKWLVPLLCRRGGISKAAIGKIQIYARETRVEISPDVSERFAAAVREPDAKDRNIHIEPVDAFVTT